MNSSAITDLTTTICGRKATDESRSRHHRTWRIFSAWIFSAPSKVLTLLVRVIAIPIVYRSLGPAQFAAYAAVVAVVSFLNVFNLGMGGALVTPLARAIADKDQDCEVSLLSSAALPVIALATLSLAVALPLLSILPVHTLFGLASNAAPEHELRAAVVLACLGTLMSVPLSIVENVRQAYQEMHVNNLLGTLSNALLLMGLLLAAFLDPKVPIFISVTAFVPVVVRILNAALLFRMRPYLMTMRRTLSWLRSRSLARDGLLYVGAGAFAHVLLYEWPIYFMARVRSPIESSTFAVFIQFTIVAMSFCMGLALPLWGATADASARADYGWLQKVVTRTRVAVLTYGVCGCVVFGLAANYILSHLLGRLIHADTKFCWAAGVYLLLATWEIAHWPFVLGLGALRAASRMVIWRAVSFAASVPLVYRFGGEGLMMSLSISIFATTAWYFPLLLRRGMANHCDTAAREGVAK